jgi:hypothetical protein
MRKGSGFSIASVFLSYLMVAGGISAALLALTYLELPPERAEIAFVAAFGAGAFIGGFFAARASHGSTVAEPVIGALLLVGTLVALLVATPIGKLMWRLAQDQLTRTAAIVGGASLAGALLGAWISEKLLGESTRSSIPWVLYVAVAVIGGCFMAFLAAAAVRFGALEPKTLGDAVDAERAQQITVFAGIGVGCLLAGLASGASARTRVLLASFLGAAGGVLGFFALASALQGTGGRLEGDALAGAAVIACGGGLVALLATALGWAAVGRSRAG